MKKQILFLIYIYTCFFGSLSNIALASDTVFQGSAEKVDEIKQQSELFTGTIDKLDNKDVLIMTVSKVLDGSVSKKDEEFFAELTNDIEGKNGTIIPSGTVAHGRIRQTTLAKRLGRDGALELDFDYLITPDGREIPITGKMSTKLHPAIATSKIIATDLGYTALGTAFGGIFAFKCFGLNSAIASQGTTIAGGAAIGGAYGLGAALYRKGKDVLISPGDEIRIKINTQSPLFVYKKTAFLQHELKQEGLDVKIDDITYEKDLYGEVSIITLSMTVSNKTLMTFSIFDLALVNDYNVAFYPSVFDDTIVIFKELKPGDIATGKVSFSVDNVKNKFWLTFQNGKDKKNIAEISLNNAYRKISDKSKKQNASFFKKKSTFYKEVSPFDD